LQHECLAILALGCAHINITIRAFGFSPRAVDSSAKSSASQNPGGCNQTFDWLREQQSLVQPLSFWPSGLRQFAEEVIGKRPSR